MQQLLQLIDDAAEPCARRLRLVVHLDVPDADLLFLIRTVVTQETAQPGMARESQYRDA